MGVLEGKVAFVTGAGTGIGRGIAELFAREGAGVVIAARREAPLREVAATAPGKISYTLMDLTKRADRIRALDTVMQRHGRLDVLVNNAADQLWKPFLEQTEEEIDCVIDTNLISTAKLIHRAVPLLQETRGNIINISSTASRYTAVPSQQLTTYSASKAGINQLTRTLVPELGPLGIRINVVAPGLTHGEVADANLLSRPQAEEMVRGLTPLGRVGDPVDIARAVLFLASEQAAWITGQVIDASGGWQVGPG
jgi:NAD(P)-dependent dehydrogenase (short-subunit alcohol dehydrogenase family)